MVDLPSIPRRLALYEGGKSSVTASEVSSVYGRWGQAMQDVAGGLEAAGEPMAQEEGRKAITRDADGNVKVDIMPMPGKLGEVYRRSAEMKFAIEAEGAIEKGLLDLRLKTMAPVEKGGFGGDPRMFEKAARDFVVQFSGKHFGGFQKIAEEMGTRASTQHLRGLMIERERLDVKNQNDTLAARETQLDERVKRLAHDNGTDSDEFRQTVADLEAVRSQRTRDPRFNYSTGEAQIANERTLAEAKGQAVIGQARRYYSSTGDIVGAQRMAEEALRKTDIPVEQRLRFLGQVETHLKGGAAIRAEQAKEVADRARAQGDMMGHASDPLDPFDPVLDETVKEARGLRQYGVAAKLQAQRVYFTWLPMLRGTAGERAEAMAAIRSDAMSAGAESGDYYASIRRAESGGDDAARAGTSSAVGRYQFLAGTWNRLAAARPDLNLTPASAGADGRLDPDQQERAIRAFTEQNEGALKASGAPVTNGTRYLAHFAGSAGAVALINAVPTASASAVLGEAAVQANPFLRNMSASDVVAWADRKGNGRGFVTAEARTAWSEVVKLAQDEYDKRAQEAWANITAALDAPTPRSPTQGEMADLISLLPMIGDPDLRDKIGKRFASMSEGEKMLAGAQNIAQARTILDDRKAAAARGELSPVQREALDHTDKQIRAQEKTIADDPVTYGSSLPGIGMPKLRALDFTSADALRSGLEERRKMRATVGQMEPMTGDSALTATDRAQIAQVMRSGDSAQAALAVTTMATVFSPQEFRAAMADSGIKDALIGMAKTGDMTKMQAAFAVLDGEFQRNAAGFDDVFGADTRRLLTTWQSRISTQSPQQVFDFMRKAQEPSAVTAQKALKDEADEKLKAVTADKVVGYFGGMLSSPGAPVTDAPAQAKGALLAEYRQEFREIYAMSGDENAAKAGALKAIGAKWGVSPANGGRVMAYPPELTYQPVNGSHDWMRPQADEAVRAAMLFNTGDVATWGSSLSSRGALPLAASVIPGPLGAAARAVTGDPQGISDRYSLIGDTRTQADKAAGRPASYGVVVMDRDGRFVIPTDPTGAPLRITFDRQRAVREAEGAFTDRRAARSEIRAFFGMGR